MKPQNRKLCSLVQLPPPRQRPVMFALIAVNWALAALWGVGQGVNECAFGWVMWFMASIIGATVTVLLAIALSNYRRSLLWVTAGLLVGVVVSIYGYRMGRAWQWESVRQSITAGDNIVSALTRYRGDHGDFPASLDALVPAYLPAIPVTSLPKWWTAHHRWQFEYERADTEVTRKAWGGYQIFVRVSESFMNPDYLCYRPSGRYPKNAVHIGKWAKLYGWSRGKDRADKPMLPRFLTH